jgi:hypothetical protein
VKSFRPRNWRAGLVVLTLVAACESTTVPTPGQSELVGRLDGKLWVGDASTLLSTGAPGGDVLYVFASSPRGSGVMGADESLSARVVFTGPGTYPLAADDVHFFELIGGDVISAEYTGSGSPAGALRITRYDGPGGVIEGELGFSAATRSEHGSYGTTATFSDGQFRAIVTAHPSQLRLPRLD